MDSILEKAAVKRAQAALDKHGISGKIKILADSARTAAEAAAGLGIEVGQIASSLVFKLPDDRSLLVITSGRHRVDTEMVGNYYKFQPLIEQMLIMLRSFLDTLLAELLHLVGLMSPASP